MIPRINALYAEAAAALVIFALLAAVIINIASIAGAVAP